MSGIREKNCRFSSPSRNCGNDLRLLGLIGIAIAFSSCDTSYTVGPSATPITKRAAKVDKHVAVAKNSADNAAAKSSELEASTRVATSTATTIGEHIEAALVDMTAHNYAAAADHLNKAQVNQATVMAYLTATLDKLRAQGRDLANVKSELAGAQTDIVEMQTELDALQVKLDQQTSASANDHVIAARCKSWFGLGAIFYGVEHMLKAGILGILILVGVGLVVIVIGYFVGGPVGAVVVNLAGRLRS